MQYYDTRVSNNSNFKYIKRNLNHDFFFGFRNRIRLNCRLVVYVSHYDLSEGIQFETNICAFTLCIICALAII